MASLPFDEYNGSKFIDLVETDFAHRFWTYLSEDARVSALVDAANRGEVAISPLMQEIEQAFGQEIAQLGAEVGLDRIKTFCLNMCKQLLEKRGFFLKACALMPPGSFFPSAGLFEKMES